MARSFTAAQWSLILAEAQGSKLCLKMTRDVEADLLLCSGADPVTVDAVKYVPREMSYNRLALGDPSTTRFDVSVDDADRDIRSTWKDERFSSNECLVTLLLRYLEGGPWESVYEVDWRCRACRYADSVFIIGLHAAVGVRKRAGLIVGTRAEFPYAPEPGASIRVGGFAANFSGGSAPPVDPPPFNPEPWGT